MPGAILEQFFDRHPQILGNTLAVAVSGGADSMALALLARDFCRTRGIACFALTVDHRLRPDSGREAEQAGQWLRGHGMAHHILAWETAQPPRSNIQEQARQARYNLLLSHCVREGIPLLLLAHHRDDQAETFLLRLGRGSGVTGLGAMPPLRQERGVWLARPLLDVPKAALREYLTQRGQPWVEDPGNADPRFARSKARALLPVLEDHDIPIARIAAAAGHLRRAAEALDHYCVRHLRDTVTVHPAGCYRLDGHAYRQAPEEIQLRGLSWLIQRLSSTVHFPRFHNLERLLRAWPEHGPFTACLGGSMLIQRSSGAAWLCREAAACPAAPWDGASPLDWDARLRLPAIPGLPPGTVCAAIGKAYPRFAAYLPDDWPRPVKAALPLLHGPSLEVEKLPIHENILAIPLHNGLFSGGVLASAAYI